MHNDVQATAQVVENQNLVGNHENNVRRPDGIRQFICTQVWLDKTHRVISKVADEAAVEPGQAFNLGHVELTMNGLDRRKRIVRLLPMNLFAFLLNEQ